MVDLRSKIHGPRAMHGVNLVVLAYHEAPEDGGSGAPTALRLDARVHPGDRRAPGETDLALVPDRSGDPVPGRDNTASYSARQLASIQRAAGPNTSEVRDDRGAAIGRAYGVRADLVIHDGAVMLNTRTLGPTELSVGPDAEGRDIRAQISESEAVARRTRAAVAGDVEVGAPAEADAVVQR